MFFPVDKNKIYDGKWSEYILVMPAIAVGNVGQLAVDLLLSTLDVEHIGYLHDSSVLPMIGADPFNSNSTKLVTSWQVYECSKKNFIIVQQRTPVALNKHREYIRLLIEWIEKHGFKMTVLLSSCFSQYFTIEELQGVTMQYLCTSKPKVQLEETFQELCWREFRLGATVNLSGELHIPGGGVTKKFYEECEENEVSLVVLLLACSEGNNYPEAISMANNLNAWLKLTKDNDVEKKDNWKIPVSWSLPFGSRPPDSIY